MVEIITDKATFDLEAETEGRLKAIIAKEKSVVPVGYIIALAGEDGDALPDVAEENEKIMAEHRQTALDAKPTGGAREALGAVGGRAHVRAVPAARRLAKEAGIDIANVPPSNGSPVITEEDVKRYLASTSGKGGAP